uniref:Putative methyltransferase n=1 Tax=viral metagenome TaxID=1070528 RepID=A0A6M3XG35_9ZZZZ
MTKYLGKFLSLDCCGDILNIVTPLSHAPKEITESMAIIERLRGEVLPDPMKYQILDLCAGNALTSLTSVFLLPVKQAVAVDKKKRNRDYHKANRFRYVELDIFTDETFNFIDENTIIISIHPCRGMAARVVEIYNNSPARSLYLMPCCIGNYRIPAKQFLCKNLGKYQAWCYYLASLCNGSIEIDANCISKANAVISAHRKPSVKEKSPAERSKQEKLRQEKLEQERKVQEYKQKWDKQYEEEKRNEKLHWEVWEKKKDEEDLKIKKLRDDIVEKLQQKQSKLGEKIQEELLFEALANKSIWLGTQTIENLVIIAEVAKAHARELAAELDIKYAIVDRRWRLRKIAKFPEYPILKNYYRVAQQASRYITLKIKDLVDKEVESALESSCVQGEGVQAR